MLNASLKLWHVRNPITKNNHMRRQTEINRAIAALKQNDTPLTRAQIEVLEGRHSETWVFDHYIRNVEDADQDETLYCAARDAAQYLTGKISLCALCPDLDDEPEQEEPDTITLSRTEYNNILKRLERLERRLGLRVGSVEKAPRKDISEAPGDLITQAEACRYIGCGKSTIKRWADRGHITGYRTGKSTQYSLSELKRSSVVQDYLAQQTNDL